MACALPCYPVPRLLLSVPSAPASHLTLRWEGPSLSWTDGPHTWDALKARCYERPTIPIPYHTNDLGPTLAPEAGTVPFLGPTGSAWLDFCDSLRGLADYIVSPPHAAQPQGHESKADNQQQDRPSGGSAAQAAVVALAEVDRNEGLRYLTRVLRGGKDHAQRAGWRGNGLPRLA